MFWYSVLAAKGFVNCIIDHCRYDCIVNKGLQKRLQAFRYNIEINLARFNVGNINISEKTLRVINLIDKLPLGMDNIVIAVSRTRGLSSLFFTASKAIAVTFGFQSRVNTNSFLQAFRKQFFRPLIIPE